MIRVLIDRMLREEGGEILQRSMKEMRREAIHCPGYVSGETLRDVANPRHYLTLSTWRSEKDWIAWVASEARGQIEERIRSLLDEPEKITVFESV